jgi:hypothetical protein
MVALVSIKCCVWRNAGYIHLLIWAQRGFSPKETWINNYQSTRGNKQEYLNTYLPITFLVSCCEVRLKQVFVTLILCRMIGWKISTLFTVSELKLHTENSVLLTHEVALRGDVIQTFRRNHPTSYKNVRKSFQSEKEQLFVQNKL